MWQFILGIFIGANLGLFFYVIVFTGKKGEM